MCAMIEKLRMKRWSKACSLIMPWHADRQGQARDFFALALVERDPGLRVRRSGVIGAGPDQAVVRVLLEDVRGPSRDATHRKNRRIQIDRNTHRVVRRRGIEVDVRIELLLTAYEGLDPLRHLEPLGVARLLAKLLRHPPQVGCARIFGAVHAMAEA